MEKSKIIIDHNIDHEFFDYIVSEEKEKIRSSLNHLNFVAHFYDGEKQLFSAIVNILDDRIHAREVAGKFNREVYRLEDFCRAIGIKLGLHYLSFCASCRATVKTAKRLGYMPDENGDFVKVI